MHVGIVAFDHGFDSALTMLRDVFRVADVLRPTIDPALPEITTTTAGVTSGVRTAGGLRVEVGHRLDLDGLNGLDVLVLPALDALNAPMLETALGRRDVRALSVFLGDAHNTPGVTFAGACTGTFVLAEAGLLDDRQATTTWWLTGLFERRYPNVALDMTRMVVASDGVTTAGAAFAHIDLAMSFVSQVSPTLADAVARHLLVDERPARSIQAVLGHLANADRLVVSFEEWIRTHLASSFDITDAARDLYVTRRTLERRVRNRCACSPATLVRRIRLEHAQHLRRTTELAADEIAHKVGYSTAASLRRALRTE